MSDEITRARREAVFDALLDCDPKDGEGFAADAAITAYEGVKVDPRTSFTEGGDLATEGRCVFRPVGWRGQTGRFYESEADAREGERGGYSPVYVQVIPE